MNRRVLLVNPRSTHVHEIGQKVFPPTNLLYLAAALRARSFEPVVLDANAWHMSDEELVRRAREIRPAVIGLALYTDILRQVRDTSEALSRACPDAKLVVGGPHASIWPRRTLDRFGAVDFVIRGEAEDALPRLCAAVAGEGDAATVAGVVLRGPDGTVVEGPPAEPPDVGTIAPPARDLVEDAYKDKRYYTIMVRERPVDSLITSRGCPFDCGFCYNFRHHYRFRSPHSVVDELVRIRDRGIRDVEICDDTFTVDHDRAMQIFDLIREQRIDVSLRIKSRVDVFDEALARAARRAGVYMCSFGMESGSQRMLDAMRKRTKPRMNARVADLCRQHGMMCHSSWLVGYPGETPATVQETLDQITRIRPTTVNISVLRPYPGTRAYELARESGDLMGDWDPDATEDPWVRLSWAPSRRSLEDTRRRMLRHVYLTPHYVGSMAYQTLRGANVTLARYALQELGKLGRRLP